MSFNNACSPALGAAAELEAAVEQARAEAASQRERADELAGQLSDSEGRHTTSAQELKRQVAAAAEAASSA